MTFSLRVACARQNLQQVRDFVRGHLLGKGYAEITINQVVLAVDEVVANFIIHGNHDDATQHLALTLALQAEVLDIEIVDEGDTIFLPPAQPAPVPDLSEAIRQRRKGGMGMALVSRLMDKVSFFTRGQHTVCQLSKRLA